jgi:hypothetical protein
MLKRVTGVSRRGEEWSRRLIHNALVPAGFVAGAGEGVSHFQRLEMIFQQEIASRVVDRRIKPLPIHILHAHKKRLIHIRLGSGRIWNDMPGD